MNKKGFSLVEVLLVVFLIGIMGVAAISNYVRSSNALDFAAKEGDILNLIRQARSYGVNNKSFNGEDCEERQNSALANHYTIEVLEQRMKIFEGGCEVSYGEIDFVGSPYNLRVFGSSDLVTQLEWPVDLSYQRGTGEFSVRADGGFISKNSDKYVVLEFNHDEEDLTHYIVMFQISGLPEVFVNLDNLQ